MCRVQNKEAGFLAASQGWFRGHRALQAWGRRAAGPSPGASPAGPALLSRGGLKRFCWEVLWGAAPAVRPGGFTQSSLLPFLIVTRVMSPGKWCQQWACFLQFSLCQCFSLLNGLIVFDRSPKFISRNFPSLSTFFQTADLWS